MKKIPIKQWSEDDRPREKMQKKGVSALSDSELIAILIGSGTKNKSAVEVSREILEKCNNELNVLAKKTIKELQNFNGIGEAKAISIVAALELGKRRKAEEVIKRKKITSSQDAFEYFHPLLCDLHHEEFHVLYLNRANNIISSEKISSGGTTGTVADIKIIFRMALENRAQAIIVAHNHPSGNIQPSEADNQLTRKIKEAAKIFDMSFLDHIIIGNNNYYSYLDNGNL
ncbi:MAG: DNA repair protein RadC [Bacteroidales bacterium]